MTNPVNHACGNKMLLQLKQCPNMGTGSSQVMPAAPLTYGYREADRSWSCVYRSVQNVQSFLSAWYDKPPRVSSLDELLAATGRQWGQWAEPAHFDLRHSPRTWRLFRNIRAEAYLTGVSDDWLKFTSAGDYGYKTSVLGDAVPHGTTAFVVDDGISGFAIVPFVGKWFWVDPHDSVGTRSDPKPYTSPVLDSAVTKHLAAAPGWMVLRVDITQ